MTDETQTDAILAHLERGLPITPLDALRLYGCFRLGARVWELKAPRLADRIPTQAHKRQARGRIFTDDGARTGYPRIGLDDLPCHWRLTSTAALAAGPRVCSPRATK